MQKCAKFFAKTNLLQSFIFKQDLWTPQLHFQWYFQGLYVFSINCKKIENSLRFGVRPQPQPQRFCCGNRNCKAGYGDDHKYKFLKNLILSSWSIRKLKSDVKKRPIVELVQPSLFFEVFFPNCDAYNRKLFVGWSCWLEDSMVEDASAQRIASLQTACQNDSWVFSSSKSSPRNKRWLNETKTSKACCITNHFCVRKTGTEIFKKIKKAAVLFRCNNSGSCKLLRWITKQSLASLKNEPFFFPFCWLKVAKQDISSCCVQEFVDSLFRLTFGKTEQNFFRKAMLENIEKHLVEMFWKQQKKWWSWCGEKQKKAFKLH